jgi:hypothetical protein
MPLRTLTGKHADPRKGRGAGVNPEGRFEQVGREGYDDGWESAAQDEERALKTIVTDERAKSIIARNDSPDIRTWLHLLLCAPQPRLSQPVAGH